MRIYINHLNLDILSNILDILKDYYIGSEKYIQIYAIDGIYQIKESSIHKLNILDNDIKIFNNYYKNFSIIQDQSYYTKELINKLPPEHISYTLKRCFFKLHKNSNIKIVIEGRENIVSYKLYNIKPNDIYIEIDNNYDIQNDVIKKDIIEFLSLLN
jgi:hypothetical protein